MSADFAVTDLLCTPTKAAASGEHASAAPPEQPSVFVPTGAFRPPPVPAGTPTHTFRVHYTAPWAQPPEQPDSPPVAGETVHSLLVPVKSDLGYFTIGEFIQEVTGRLSRRYGTLPCHVSGLKLYVAEPAADWDAADLPSMEEAEALYKEMQAGLGSSVWDRPYPTRNGRTPVSASPAGSPCGAGAGEPTGRYVAIDAVMNATDTFDCFIPQPTFPARGVARPAGSAAYEARIEWEAGPPPTATPALAATSWAAEQSQPPPQQQRTLSQCAQSGSNSSLVPVNAFTSAPRHGRMAVSLPVMQRSAYVDLLTHRRRLGDRDACKAGESGSSDSEDDDMGAMEGLGGAARRFIQPKAKVRRAQKLYEERLDFEKAEQVARGFVMDEEEIARRPIVEEHDDSIKYFLTLAVLQGDFTRNGGLAALIQRYRMYPLDTLPLANERTPEEAARLEANARDTAMQSYQFADMKPRPKKTPKEVARDEMRELYLPEEDKFNAIVDSATGEHIGYRELMREAVEYEREVQERALRDELWAEYFIERGEPVPPREPTPPPTPPTPTTPCMEELPQHLLAATLDELSAGCHEIYRAERKSFRSMTTLMRSILAKQLEADAVAVRQAYKDELEAAEALFSYDFNTFASTDHVRPTPAAKAEDEVEEREDDADRDVDRDAEGTGEARSTPIIFKHTPGPPVDHAARVAAAFAAAADRAKEVGRAKSLMGEKPSSRTAEPGPTDGDGKVAEADPA